jgi:uncharacterized protein (TIGR03435 family)
MNPNMVLAVSRPGSPDEAAEPAAGMTLVEALEKQLGLKPEAQKRSEPVIVIDHLEQTPSDN